MKIKHLLFTLLSAVMVSCNADNALDIDIYNADCKVDHELSRQLVDRFNLIRIAKGSPIMSHDTILDNICRLIVSNRSYFSKDGIFKEDSIRQLIHDNGIIDYQFSIGIVADKDTSKLFNSYLMSKDTCNSSIGYLSYSGKQMIIKTFNHLTFVQWFMKCHSDPISGFDNGSSAQIFTDSIACTLSTTGTGRYYCQFSDHIPLSRENLAKLKRFEMQKTVSIFAVSTNVFFDLTIGTTDVNKYFVITDENNNRLAVLK